MSVGKTVRHAFRLPLAVLAALAGWVLIGPVALLVPKRRDWVAVIGRQDGLFLDNAKYFFLHAAQEMPGLRLMFVTERTDVVILLRMGGMEALRYPGWKAVIFLLRCNCVVVDEAAWHRRFRAFLSIRARVIQLWHGVGFKWIEAGLWAHEVGSSRWFSARCIRPLRVFAYRITRRHMCYEAVTTTSRFYRDEVFTPAFLARHFPVIGYPRNDFARSLTERFRELAWSNVDADVRKSLKQWLDHSRRVVLVAPTFRDSGSMPMQLDDAARAAMQAFAATHGIEFVFKFHPAERNADRISGQHFHVCERDSDIYPLFPYAAALITDYSSIGMDFLLVDRPILFLAPKDDDYLENDRQLQFDPRSMMPGPVAGDWKTLLGFLEQQWAHDTHADERARLCDKAFDGLNQADAVPKLLAFMQQNDWIPMD